MKETKAAAPRYGKEQLIRSGIFNVFAAQAVLREGREYTVEEAQKLIGEFMEREVK
jgi:hypothetical protein